MSEPNSQRTKSCHNCGLPNWAISRQGVTLKLRLKAEGAFHRRDRHITVWCCGEDCAWQALAIAVMGLPTHKWPIRLRDFVSLNPELLKQSKLRSDCNETPISDPHKQRGCEGAKTESEPLPLPAGFVTRKGGRPRIHKDGAARVRAHRAKRRQRAGTRESREPIGIAGTDDMTGENVSFQSPEQPDPRSGIALPERTLKKERFDENFK